MNSSNQTLCKEYSQKQLALFRSVISLLEEGVSSSEMRVSEIASRAGVGKGTTYEYFKSKEELIAEAVLYDLSIRIAELTDRVEQASDFKQMFYTILDWLEENLQAKHVLNRILGMDGMDLQITGDICTMVKCRTEEMNYIQTGIEGLINVAQQEGLIVEHIPQSLRTLSFINQMFSYVAYLKMEQTITDVSKKEIKEFLYNSLIRALQG